MKILIVGAGMAGLTLAALLQQRGETPVVIEKAKQFGEAGYMIGLYPLGSDVFHGLGCHEQYVRETEALTDYYAFKENGKLIKHLPLNSISEGYGAYQCMPRSYLVQLLSEQCATDTIRFGLSIEKLTQDRDGVQVTFTDGHQDVFDVVVGADGFHSRVRDLILAPGERSHYDSGWGGWVWWSDKNPMPAHAVQEYWGVHTFLGAYPVKERVGVIAAVPYANPQAALKGQARREYIHKQFSKVAQVCPDLLDAFPADDAPMFFWPLTDVRSKQWVKGRVVLVGDAGDAFLPTAGVGASMAMASAAVLNDVLARTDRQFVERALQLFVKRRQKRVVDAHEDSRKLARMMFVKSPFKAWIRDYVMQKSSLRSLLNSIAKNFDEPL